MLIVAQHLVANGPKTNASRLPTLLNQPVFTPISTERLLLRPMRESDAEGLAERRSNPAVAEYQNWPVPFPLEQAEQMVAELQTMDGPQNDEWWMAAVCLRDGTVIGDLAVHLTWERRSAELGYNFAPEHWGQGYAVESLDALIEYLFATGVHRIFGMLHPDNVASAMVLERCGLLYEGHTKESYWKDDEVSDDWIYGMTRPDWEAWRARPRHHPAQVELVPVTVENESKVFKLKTHKSQESFVAPMEGSFADALFPEVVDGGSVVPWMRGVMADGEYVGFVMLAEVTDHHPEPYLWRLLIDRMHQRRGIAGRALELVYAECKSREWDTLLTSWVPGKGSPEPFYLKHGFVPTGEIIEGEIEARKHLTRS